MHYSGASCLSVCLATHLGSLNTEDIDSLSRPGEEAPRTTSKKDASVFHLYSWFIHFHPLAMAIISASLSWKLWYYLTWNLAQMLIRLYTHAMHHIPEICQLSPSDTFGPILYICNDWVIWSSPMFLEFWWVFCCCCGWPIYAEPVTIVLDILFSLCATGSPHFLLCRWAHTRQTEAV